MNSKRALRTSILAMWAMIVATLISSFLLEGTLPAPLRDYLEAEYERDLAAMDMVVVVGGLAFLMALIIGSVGLFFFKSWARWVYLAGCGAASVFLLVAGPSVEHPVPAALDYAATLVSGVVLAIAFVTNAVGGSARAEKLAP